MYGHDRILHNKILHSWRKNVVINCKLELARAVVSMPTVRAAALSSGFAPCAQADMSRLLKLLVTLVKRADSRCNTSCGCRSGSTEAHHRSSELVAARMTSKKSGSQEGKSCWGARAARSRPALSKPSHAAYSVIKWVNTHVEVRLCTIFQVAS